jgi:small subunit ribosomal protein S16
MAVKLRLTRVGKTKQPQYRIVAADSRSPRDGRFIEIIGQYNPRQEPSVVNLDADKAAQYLADGAQPTERVAKLLLIAGVELPAKVAAKVGGPAARSGTTDKVVKKVEKKAEKAATEADAATAAGDDAEAAS